MMRLAIALLLALSADALVLSPTRALALSPARALALSRINMCAEGPTVASSPDVSRAMIKDGFKEMNWSIAVFATWKPKLKAAFATADPGTGWIGPKELSTLMASCGEAVDEAKCEAIITAAAAATSRVATGTMNEQEFYKLMMGEIEA